MASSIRTLQYDKHNTHCLVECLICLEPVAAKVVHLSCHDHISCAECISYWIGSQVVARKQLTCPHCRGRIDTSNLRSADGVFQWSDVEAMAWSAPECEDEYDECDDYSDKADDYFDEADDYFDEDDDSYDEEKSMNGSDDELPLEQAIMNLIRSANTMEATELGDAVRFPEEPVQDPARALDSPSGSAGLESDDISTRKDRAIPDLQLLVTPQSTQEKSAERCDADSTPSSQIIKIRTAAKLQRDTRRANIVLKRIPEEKISALLSVQPIAVRLPLKPYNTLYVSDLPSPAQALLLCAVYGEPRERVWYFFWVQRDTTIGELAKLWNCAQYGESCDTARVRGAEWTFLGRVLSWTETVEEAGMRNWSVFKIPGILEG